MHTSRTVALLAVACGVLVACSDSTGPGMPLLSGAWSMTLYADGFVVPGEFTFTEDDGTVSGTGSIVANGRTYTFTATGRHTHPAVRLTVASEDFHDMNFEGEFRSYDLVEGTVTGSGFTGQRMKFERR